MNSQLSPQTVARLQKTVPLIVALILAVLLGAQLAKLIWLLVPAPEDGLWIPRPAQSADAPAANQKASTINIAAIQQAKLFGEFRPEAVEQQTQVAENAPDTNLRLKLRGILAMENASESRALIEQTRGELKAYAIGMSIPGGAELHSIYVDRVLLKRGGRLETLRLEKDEVADTSPRGSAAQSPVLRALGGSAPRILDSETAAKLSTIRTELLNDPSKASQYLRVQPARNDGVMRGYRIYPGRNRELFQQAGLRPGDVVTSINGVSLDDPSKSFQLLGDLSSAQQLNLQIERGGQLQSVSVNLN